MKKNTVKHGQESGYFRSSVSLGYDALQRIMPFHLIVDTAGSIIHVGRSFSELIESDDLLGKNLFHIFRIHRRRTLPSMLELLDEPACKLRFTLRSNSSIELLGEWVPIENSNGTILLDLLPSLKSQVRGDANNLTTEHFPVADLSSELKALVQMHRHLLERAERLNKDLELKSRRLEANEASVSLTNEVLSASLQASLVTVSYANADASVMHLGLGYQAEGAIGQLMQSGLFGFYEIEDWIQSHAKEVGLEFELERLENNPLMHFSYEVASEDDRYWSLIAIKLRHGARALICSDVSTIKLNERAYSHRNKMAALGVLISGVAHDFNNLLAIISGGLELLNKQNPDSKKPLDMIGSAVVRSERLVRQLLNYSALPKSDQQQTDLSQLLMPLHSILLSILGPGYTLDVELKHHAIVECDTCLFEATIINLVVNARDAMVHGGRIILRTRSTSHHEIKSLDLDSEHNYVAIDVIDEGGGINAKVAKRMFDPFFTTKKLGSGAGLGLSIVYNFASKSGGSVALTNNEQTGATLTVYLPDCSPMLSRVVQKDVEVKKTSDSLDCSVLIVDDEQSLGFLLKESLLHFGVQAMTVDSVNKCNEILTTQSEFKPNVVLTDYYLVDGTGDDIIRLVNETVPSAVIIIMSGNRQLRTHEPNMEACAVLSKPFSISTLIDTITRELSKSVKSQSLQQEKKTVV